MNRETKMAKARVLYQNQNGLTVAEADALWPSLPPRDEAPVAEDSDDADEEASTEPVRGPGGRFASAD